MYYQTFEFFIEPKTDDQRAWWVNALDDYREHAAIHRPDYAVLSEFLDPDTRDPPWKIHLDATWRVRVNEHSPEHSNAFAAGLLVLAFFDHFELDDQLLFSYAETQMQSGKGGGGVVIVRRGTIEEITTDQIIRDNIR